MWMVLLFPIAHAGSASSVVLEDGTVLGTVSVRAAVEVARAKISDPLWVTATEGGTTRVTITGLDGACRLLESVSPSVIVDVQYATRLCPTPDGVVATLRSSNTFTSYMTSWRVRAEGTGSRLEYRLALKTSLMLPQSFINGTTQKRVLEMMEKVGAALDR